ncbi:MAG: AtpZ/AtpI family protein [Bacteroidota bacterium]
MQQKPPDKKRPHYDDLARYGSMAFQMLAIMGLGVYGGMKLDEWLGFKKFPFFTLILSLLSAFGAMYLMIKDVLKKK